MCREMANLVSIADVTTPNITEACILTNREYEGMNLEKKNSRLLCGEIKELGANMVVLTGVQRGNTLYNCGIDQNGEYFELPVDLLPFHMHGTGDLFASIVTGGLVKGFSLQKSVNSAAAFIYDAMLYSKDVEDAFARGVAFEPLVHKLNEY
jgi:pyridoxine kinase